MNNNIIVEYKINDQTFAITQSSFIINGNEFKFNGIRAIKHSAEKKVYLFKYGSQWCALYYTQEVQPVVSDIFGKIIEATKNPGQPAFAGQAPVSVKQPSDKPKTPAEELASIISEKAERQETAAAEHIADKQMIQTESENLKKIISGETVETTESDVAVGEGDESSSESEESLVSYGETSAKAEISDKENNPSRKRKLKKSIIIFIIIIVLFVAAGVAWFFIWGPANDASNTNTNNTHEYDDIEDLIDEMQE